MATKQRAASHPLASPGSSRSARLIRRDGLYATLDRATLRKVTVISAPPGSGKTSLLRGWAERARADRLVGFVPVPRDQHDAQQFWRAVLDGIAEAGALSDSRRQALEAAVEGDQIVDTLVSELADAGTDLVVVIDDLHELRSTEAVSQLERLLILLPRSVHVVLSSRKDPPVRLHQLRLADEVMELLAGDLRFSLIETRELLAASDIT